MSMILHTRIRDLEARLDEVTCEAREMDKALTRIWGELRKHGESQEGHVADCVADSLDELRALREVEKAARALIVWLPRPETRGAALYSSHQLSANGMHAALAALDALRGEVK